MMKSSGELIRTGVLALLLCLVLMGMRVSAGTADNSKVVLTSLEERMQKQISVDFVNTPIDDVLRIMSEQAGVDIVKSPKVTGTVTARLTDVPLGEAISNILTVHGYGYVATENMVRIAPLSDITQKAEVMMSRIYRINYADVKEVKKALDKFVSKQGAVSANLGTSNIIVTDTESKIKAIDTFVAEIDRITPQILVEARIYDVSSTDRLDLGVEWYFGRNTTYGSIGTPGSNPSAGHRDPYGTGFFDSAISQTPKTDSLLRFGILNDALDIDMVLTANSEKTCAKLLASPRVLVLDNEQANFKIVQEIPYQELTQTSGGGNIGTTEFKEVGVELGVVPHLTRDGMIRLHIQPKFSVQTDTVSLIIPTTSDPITSPQPVVDKREADTKVLVRDGSTVVVGGLHKQDVTKEVSKVPLLGDIPLLGALFKFEGEKTINSELVVFITPRIIIEPVLDETEMMQYEETEPDCRPNCPELKGVDCRG